MTMDKAEFLRILEEGGEAPGDRFSWVNLLSELQVRETPFTKSEIAKEYSVKPNYVYSHLRDWVTEGKLAVIKHGGMNVYLAKRQIEG